MEALEKSRNKGIRTALTIQFLVLFLHTVHCKETVYSDIIDYPRKCNFTKLMCNESRLLKEDKIIILNIANEMRNRVAEGSFSYLNLRHDPVSNMNKLHWNTELEKKAASIVSSCPETSPSFIDQETSILPGMDGIDYIKINKSFDPSKYKQNSEIPGCEISTITYTEKLTFCAPQKIKERLIGYLTEGGLSAEARKYDLRDFWIITRYGEPRLTYRRHESTDIGCSYLIRAGRTHYFSYLTCIHCAYNGTLPLIGHPGDECDENFQHFDERYENLCSDFKNEYEEIKKDQNFVSCKAANDSTTTAMYENPEANENASKSDSNETNPVTLTSKPISTAKIPQDTGGKSNTNDFCSTGARGNESAPICKSSSRASGRSTISLSRKNSTCAIEFSNLTRVMSTSSSLSSNKTTPYSIPTTLQPISIWKETSLASNGTSFEKLPELSSTAISTSKDSSGGPITPKHSSSTTCRKTTIVSNVAQEITKVSLSATNLTLASKETNPITKTTFKMKSPTILPTTCRKTIQTSEGQLNMTATTLMTTKTRLTPTISMTSTTTTPKSTTIKTTVFNTTAKSKIGVTPVTLPTIKTPTTCRKTTRIESTEKLNATSTTPMTTKATTPTTLTSTTIPSTTKLQSNTTLTVTLTSTTLESTTLETISSTITAEPEDGATPITLVTRSPTTCRKTTIIKSSEKLNATSTTPVTTKVTTPFTMSVKPENHTIPSQTTPTTPKSTTIIPFTTTTIEPQSDTTSTVTLTSITLKPRTLKTLPPTITIESKVHATPITLITRRSSTTCRKTTHIKSKGKLNITTSMTRTTPSSNSRELANYTSPTTIVPIASTSTTPTPTTRTTLTTTIEPTPTTSTLTIPAQTARTTTITPTTCRKTTQTESSGKSNKTVTTPMPKIITPFTTSAKPQNHTIPISSTITTPLPTTKTPFTTSVEPQSSTSTSQVSATTKLRASSIGHRKSTCRKTTKTSRITLSVLETIPPTNFTVEVISTTPNKSTMNITSQTLKSTTSITTANISSTSSKVTTLSPTIIISQKMAQSCKPITTPKRSSTYSTTDFGKTTKASITTFPMYETKPGTNYTAWNNTSVLSTTHKPPHTQYIEPKITSTYFVSKIISSSPSKMTTLLPITITSPKSTDFYNSTSTTLKILPTNSTTERITTIKASTLLPITYPRTAGSCKITSTTLKIPSTNSTTERSTVPSTLTTKTNFTTTFESTVEDTESTLNVSSTQTLRTTKHPTTLTISKIITLPSSQTDIKQKTLSTKNYTTQTSPKRINQTRRSSIIITTTQSTIPFSPNTTSQATSNRITQPIAFTSSLLSTLTSPSLPNTTNQSTTNRTTQPITFTLTTSSTLTTLSLPNISLSITNRTTQPSTFTPTTLSTLTTLSLPSTTSQSPTNKTTQPITFTPTTSSTLTTPFLPNTTNQSTTKRTIQPITFTTTSSTLTTPFLPNITSQSTTNKTTQPKTFTLTTLSTLTTKVKSPKTVRYETTTIISPTIKLNVTLCSPKISCKNLTSTVTTIVPSKTISDETLNFTNTIIPNITSILSTKKAELAPKCQKKSSTMKRTSPRLNTTIPFTTMKAINISETTYFSPVSSQRTISTKNITTHTTKIAPIGTSTVGSTNESTTYAINSNSQTTLDSEEILQVVPIISSTIEIMDSDNENENTTTSNSTVPDKSSTQTANTTLDNILYHSTTEYVGVKDIINITSRMTKSNVTILRPITISQVDEKTTTSSNSSELNKTEQRTSISLHNQTKATVNTTSTIPPSSHQSTIISILPGSKSSITTTMPSITSSSKIPSTANITYKITYGSSPIEFESSLASVTQKPSTTKSTVQTTAKPVATLTSLLDITHSTLSTTGCPKCTTPTTLSSKIITSTHLCDPCKTTKDKKVIVEEKTEIVSQINTDIPLPTKPNNRQRPCICINWVVIGLIFTVAFVFAWCLLCWQRVLLF